MNENVDPRVAAIDDAIGIPGAVTQLPVTPQRLKAIIDGKR
jgi:carbon-monoxide dehydrogenase large subunit/6-hydroxypseudooxynicotine dehydrogenase subunit gamma